MIFANRALRAHSNFAKLFLSFFVSEFGGFLTNTAIVLHINARTDGDLFYLGLGHMLLVLPLALGTAIGGSVGEVYNKKKVMLTCECINLLLVTSLVFLEDALGAILLIRALIVLSAGIYGPSRQAIVQEVIDPRYLRLANAGFSSTFALFHALSPFAAVLLYNAFDGVQEIFAFNSLTYALGTLLLLRMHYTQAPQPAPAQRSVPNVLQDLREGLTYIRSRPDLVAIQFTFLVSGITLGAFYPSILPFIRDVYQGGDALYAELMLCISLGAICGALVTPWLLQHVRTGRILVAAAFLQAGCILLWTALEQLLAACGVLFAWGALTMIGVTVYQNHVQLQVPRQVRTRTFSLFELTISAANFIGAASVMLIGTLMDAQWILTAVALLALAVLVARAFGRSMRVLYQMPA